VPVKGGFNRMIETNANSFKEATKKVESAGHELDQYRLGLMEETHRDSLRGWILVGIFGLSMTISFLWKPIGFQFRQWFPPATIRVQINDCAFNVTQNYWGSWEVTKSDSSCKEYQPPCEEKHKKWKR
jgi:hypothetical protein